MKHIHMIGTSRRTSRFDVQRFSYQAWIAVKMIGWWEVVVSQEVGYL